MIAHLGSQLLQKAGFNRLPLDDLTAVTLTLRLPISPEIRL